MMVGQEFVRGQLCQYHGSEVSWRGGWRLCVVETVGRKHARLVDVGDLSQYRMSLRELSTARPAPENAVPTRIARTLRRRRRQPFTGDFEKVAIRRALAALDGKPSAETDDERETEMATTKKTKATTKRAKKAGTAKKKATAPKKEGASGKAEQLRSMLQRESGATLPEICAAFKWLPHSARAAISTLNKSLGGKIVREKLEDKTSVYRLSA